MTPPNTTPEGIEKSILELEEDIVNADIKIFKAKASLESLEKLQEINRNLIMNYKRLQELDRALTPKSPETV